MDKRLVYLLFLTFLFTRLINLGAMPPFNDESIYLEWGILSVANLKPFLSLADGKTPFSIWIFGVLGMLTSYPLTAARLGSVLAGGLTFLGIVKISRNYKLGYFPALLYVFAPAYVFFDRQALAESMLTASGIWIIYLTSQVLKNKSMKYPLLLTTCWALGIYIKTSAVIFVLTSAIIILSNNKQEEFKNKLATLVCSFFVLVLPLLIQQNLGKIFTLNSRFSLSAAELISFPVLIWGKNIFSVVDVLLIQILGLTILTAARPRKKVTYFYYWITIPLFFYILLTRNASVRYLTPLAIPTIFLAADAKRRKLLTSLTLIFFVLLDVMLIVSPNNYFQKLAQISRYSQIDEYTKNFSSGFEAKEALVHLESLSERKDKALIITRADFGNPESSVFYYFYKNKNVRTQKIFGQIPMETLIYLDQNFDVVYYVAREDNLDGNNQYFELEKKFPNPESQYYVGVYKLNFAI